MATDSPNNRILKLVAWQKKIVCQCPKPVQPSQSQGDDDVLLDPHHYNEILTNREGYNMVSILNFSCEKVV